MQVGGAGTGKNLFGRKLLFYTRNIIANLKKVCAIASRGTILDMAALARHGLAERALGRDDLRQRVADWKARFFTAKWARYDLAKPGTFRLVPPEFRLAELERDYRCHAGYVSQSAAVF